VRRAILHLGSLACLLAVVGVVLAKLHPPFKWALQDLQPLCSDVLCLHFYARMWSIEYAIRRRGADPVYLAIGDSITEGAELASLCGRKPINAGIGGATVETFATHARRLADLAKPDFIIVALGGNDALRGRESGFRERMTALLASLAAWPVLVVPLPPGPGVKDAAKFNIVIEGLDATKAKPLDHVETTDGIHLTPAAYGSWRKSIADALPKSYCAAQISN
jgi:GDSL-like Lipase/Acylhydrolase family